MTSIENREHPIKLSILKNVTELDAINITEVLRATHLRIIRHKQHLIVLLRSTASLELQGTI